MFKDTKEGTTHYFLKSIKQNNMKLEQQVCSLELAKKLKELGVKQESLFWYSKNAPAAILFDSEGKRDQKILEGWTDDDFVSAFTVAELGEMLPMSEQFKVPGGWVVRYHRSVDFWEEMADTEADARAKMLIYLLENSLINI